MKRRLLALALSCVAVGTLASVAVVLKVRDVPGWDKAHRAFRMPNGWTVTPQGQSVGLPGDMPVEIKVSRDGQSVYLVTAGYHDLSVDKVRIADLTLEKSLALPHVWAGMAETDKGELWVSGGQAKKDGPAILRLSPANLESQGVIASPETVEKPYVAGITLGPEGNVYALNIQTDQIMAFDQDGHFLQSAGTSYRPFRIVAMPDGKTLAVANWGDASVSFFRAFDLKETAKVIVGPHPAALAAAPDGRLFVANAGDRTVSVIKDGKVIQTIRTGVGNLPQAVGSTPLSLALDAKRGTLYVANAGDNCVTVVDVKGSSAKVKGLIPTGRYPSEIALTPDGKDLLVATAKGFYGPNATAETRTSDKPEKPYTYIGNQLEGRLYKVPVPTSTELAKLTRQAEENVVHPKLELSPEQIAEAKAALSHIKHVVYIIKENRTYDQVLGDLPGTNGDPTLTIFGEKITPNIHSLSRTFTTLDNLYCDGETSQPGHQWTDAAYANDYTEKQWILNYGRHGEVESDSRLTSSPGEYIWTLARAHGVSERVYGEYVNLQEDHEHADAAFANRMEQMNFSDEVEKIFARGGRDPEKVTSFLKEMHAAESTGNWPALMVMALPEDHTRGFSPGAYSPSAMVASNDQAVGQLIEGISHSKFWPETAVFVIQDDAQAAPDHVDSHRTEGLFISPYTKRHAVDSTHYTTSSMLKTMETILHLPPMTEFDATATPMLACLQTKPDLTPYDLVPASYDVNEKNPPKGTLAERSTKLDFSAIDLVDPDVFNRLLWDGLKPGVPYPRPK